MIADYPRGEGSIWQKIFGSEGYGPRKKLRLSSPAGDRRLHYSGQSAVFTVRNAGHSAGFDEAGMLRIY